MALSGHFRPVRGEPWAAADGADPAELLQLHAAHGPSMLQKMRGPFALALFDGETLLLARDAFGQKPLYYCAKDGELWFGSDLSCLRAEGAPLGLLDRDALSDYLELLYVPAPASVWTGVRKLPAGHLLRAGGPGVEGRRWFELPAPGSTDARPSRIAVRARLEEAVRAAEATDAAAVLPGGQPAPARLAPCPRRPGNERTLTADAHAARHPDPQAVCGLARRVGR